MIKSLDKVGRNDSCPCGSGKKYKRCCMPDNKPQKKVLSPAGFQRCFLKLVKDAGGEVDISCLDLEELPKDEMLGIVYDGVKDLFKFKVVKVKLGKILQPEKRIIV